MLVKRQERAYNLRADLFKPDPLKVGLDQLARDLTYPPTPTYPLVRCRRTDSAEINTAQVPGRTNYDISLTLDVFKFAFDQEIEDGWLVRVHPVPNSPPDRQGFDFYVTQGGGQDHPSVGRRHANQRRVLVVKVPKPRDIENGGLLVMLPANPPAF